MQLTPTVSTWLTVIALLLALGALGVGIYAVIGQRQVRRAYQSFSMGSRDDVLTLIQRHIDEVGLLRGDVRRLRRHSDDLREALRGAVSKVGTVRYDAFDDMGGRLSYSTALLDERGDGVVLTAINGRTYTRSYAKPVVGWTSRHNLSGEEEAAIRRARQGGRTQTDEPAADAIRVHRPGARREPGDSVGDGREAFDAAGDRQNLVAGQEDQEASAYGAAADAS